MIRTFKYLNLVFFLLMIGVNALANLLPLGIGHTGDISKKYENLFTPAPVTFFIWAIIYVLLAIFVIYQLGIFGNTAVSEAVVRLVGPWFILTCIMNICWIFSWHYDMTWLSVVFMLGLLISLIILVTRFTLNSTRTVSSISSLPLSACISVYAFEIYIGWITAATIANISVLLVKLDWNRFGLSSQFWTILIIIIGALIGALFISFGGRYMAAIAVIWAYCGILIKHISQAGYGGTYPLIITATIFGIIIIATTGLIKAIMDLNSLS